jgi:geranylgeranyl reductase family protein
MRDDVAIVGAGPAGAWAAWRLARCGARVAIFDPSHPREKACGGGVTGRALALVGDALGSDSFPRTIVRAARFTAVERQRTRTAADADAESPTVALDDDALVVASRAAFDTSLVDAAVRAGARLIRARVSDVAIDAHGATLQTTAGRATAAIVVGADGANSLVRRRVARPFRRDQLSIATGFYAHGATSGEIVVELTGDPPGYIWSFPRPDHLAVGICAQADAGVGASALRARTRAWIDRTGLAPGATLAPYSWPIPSLTARDYETLPLAGERWALVGDAAGLVDPITREGIFFALRSADALAAALATGESPASCVEPVRDELTSELARAARLKAGFFRPAFVGLLLHALEQSAAVRSVMADLIAGRQTYATLKWRLVKTLEVRLAWQALGA